MPARMTAEMLTFWRELCAPFDDSLLSTKPGRGGKPMTWLDKRAIENRLDSVCGPHGWDVEYRPTQRGFIARMGIDCPMPDGTWRKVYKEDGAGFEEMDAVDDDEKSGYTNALRRVAQDAWGIGRWLYRKGIPDYLDPKFMATQAEPEQWAGVPDAPVTQSPRKFEYAKVPPQGRNVFPWIKELEKHFNYQLWMGVKSDAISAGYSQSAQEWTKDQWADLSTNMIRHIKTIPGYAGEFDGVATDDPAAGGAPEKPKEDDLKPAKVKLAQTIKEVIVKQTGKAPEKADAIAMLVHFATASKNRLGELGAALRSLAECDDAIWILNMQRAAEDQLKLAVTANPDSGEADLF